MKRTIVNIIYQQLASDVILPELNQHDLDHDILTKDLHPPPLIKKVIDKYVTIRLLINGKNFNKDVLHKDKNQNKTTIDKGSPV